MSKFNNFMFKSNIQDKIDESGIRTETFYDLAMYLAENNATEIHQMNELLGGLGNMMGGLKTGIQNIGQNVTNGLNSMGQNASNAYKTGENKAKIQQAYKTVGSLQNNLKQIGFTEPKVQNFLGNIGHLLQMGLGQNKTAGGQQMQGHQGTNMPDFNTLRQNAINLHKTGQMNQSGGTGI